ncbi:hypothetical protein PoB_003078300 [Plakobranchus ocellatus]|uniref:Uncharacterized protein n=1 Tax=Plakobranchus ocellatus TaxID=259542 RepID=A0AAV4ABY8_9GAST|nr:hypothetical protein PoB_003078300 [Plakobranchus ocellatus]
MKKLREELKKMRQNTVNQLEEKWQDTERHFRDLSRENNHKLKKHEAHTDRKKECASKNVNKKPGEKTKGDKNRCTSSDFRNLSSSSFDEGPSTSKSALGSGGTVFAGTEMSVKSSKRRKKFYEDEGEEEMMSEDSLDDMAHHQVSRNEWWLEEAERKQKKRHRVRGGVKVREKKQRFSELLPDMEEYNNDVQRDHTSSSSSARKPETLFVYVDEQTPFSCTNQDSEVSERLGHFDHSLSPGFSYGPRHDESTTHFRHEERSWNADKSPWAVKSKSDNFRSRERQSNRKNNYNSDHAIGRDSYDRNQAPRKSHSKRWRHPGSRQQPQDFKNRRSEFAPYNSGFQARHERFVSMKNDCDFRVSLRK